MTTSGRGLAGSNYTMICAVLTTDVLLSAPIIEWVGPEGVVIPANFMASHDSCSNSIVYASEINQNGNVSSVELRFSCLRTSQSGEYSCRARSSLPLIGLTQTTVAMETLAVKRKSHTFYSSQCTCKVIMIIQNCEI